MPLRVKAEGGVRGADGEMPMVERSAREVLKELDDDAKAASVLKSCLMGPA